MTVCVTLCAAALGMEEPALFHMMTGNDLYVELVRERAMPNQEFLRLLMEIGGTLLPRHVTAGVCGQQRFASGDLTECPPAEARSVATRRPSLVPLPAGSDLVLVAESLPAVFQGLTEARMASDIAEGGWLETVHTKVNVPLFKAFTELKMVGTIDPSNRSGVLFASMLEQLHYRMVSAMAPPVAEFFHTENVLQFGLGKLMKLAGVQAPIREIAPVVEQSSWFCIFCGYSTQASRPGTDLASISPDEKQQQLQLLSQFMNAQLDALAQEVGRTKPDDTEFKNLRYLALERHTAIRAAIALFPELPFDVLASNGPFLQLLGAVGTFTNKSSLEPLAAELDVVAKAVRSDFFDVATAL